MGIIDEGFAYCHQIESISIPKSVTKMGNGVFQNQYFVNYPTVIYCEAECLQVNWGVNWNEYGFPTYWGCEGPIA